MTLTDQTITMQQIARLHDDAMTHGDYEQERTCRIAMNDYGTVSREDQQRARQRCADAINRARAPRGGDPHPCDRRCDCDACTCYGLQLLGANG